MDPIDPIDPIDKTQYFFELTPDRVLDAVEASGLVPTGRCFTLNSFENRVYDIELDVESLGELYDPKNPSSKFRIAKFYRPGRWTETQILEEHQFIADLKEAEIPAVAPCKFQDGSTLHQMKDSGIWYTLFPKIGGRAPDELNPEQLRWIGRLLGRIHNVGATGVARHRIELTPESYGLVNLKFLIEGKWIPLEFQARYQAAVEAICEMSAPHFKGVKAHRLHGDCHLGNLLLSQNGPFFVDFDDMVIGPAIQDLWLLLPGRPSEQPEAKRQLELLLEGYEEMREFDRSTLRLIEPLRALRYVHYTTWVARRWKDPAFPLAFPNFGTHRYWSDETDDLEKQLRFIEQNA